MNQFSYRSGSWQVVVEEGGVAAVPGDVAPEQVARLTRMLQQGAPALTEVIDVLAAGSIATLGSFAVALTSGRDVRFAVRGPVTVRIGGSAGAEVISGADVSTWSERYVADSQGFELVLDEQSGAATYPIRSGVVLAGAVRAGEDAGIDVPLAVSVPVAASVPVLPDVADEPPLAASDDAASDAHPELQTLIPTEHTFAPEPPPAPVLPPVSVAAAFDSALEQTVQVAPSAPVMPPPLAALPLSVDVPPMPPAPPIAPPPAPGIGDHDGATISLAEVRRLRAEAGGEPPSPDAPTEVLSTASDSSSPSHGRVRISTGQVIELDRTVIIGRRPRSTRASGETMPHLVAVDSPQQDISRSHLEIRPEGDSVVVIDLRTTNGSTLIRPGTDPMRLHPAEHTLVLSGDTVDLGDGVTVTFEGLV